MRLSRPLLLDVLRRLSQQEAVGALRGEVERLRDELAQPGSALRAAAEGDAAVFSRRVLAAELDQIAQAQTLERARYYVERLARSITEVRTAPINDINLNRWKEYDDILTDSLWQVERRDSSGVHTAAYWGNFIPQIPHQMMRRYTRRGDWVIDPFAGSGTTLIEARRLGRNALGVDLQPAAAELARRLASAEPSQQRTVAEIYTGDSATFDFRGALERHGRQQAQLLVLHPPYFDIIRFSDDPRDLSNAGSVEAFLERLGQVVENVAPALESGRYLALVIGDKYARGEWIPLGFLSMNELLRRGFSLKSIVVKNFEGTAGKRQQKELWKYRALAGGFYVFKHEYIFVLKKR
ncbi:MAG TPA: DNA methyltransferase [Roseiflexaceae bacterium]|nr:DNA methyltransferase [Roseiflexaceae bacterium]